MKDILKNSVSGFALGLMLFAGYAFAQNINRAIQLSQDPTGPIQVDTQNNVYWPGHFLLNTTNRPAPTLSSCGSAPAPTITGTDFSFKLVTGGTATACTITFGTAYVTAPQCIIQANGGATEPTYTTSTTAIAITTDIASTTYSGVCFSVS